jgi:hypothetical protein
MRTFLRGQRRLFLELMKPRNASFGVPLYALFVMTLIYLFVPKSAAAIAVFYGLFYLSLVFLLCGIVRAWMLRERA